MANKEQLAWISTWLPERPDFNFRSLLAERASLSAEERTKIEVERLGLESEIEETPELLENSFASLEEALDDIEHKEAYETALFINPTHVTSDEMRLAFLRVERYDAAKAAKRMVHYWERKVEVFGYDRAFHNYVSIFDLQEQDYPALLKGGVCALPLHYHDGAGRGIFFENLAWFTGDVDSMIRIMWYNVHAAIFDPEDGHLVQKLGLVVVTTNGHTNQIHPFPNFKEFERYNNLSTMDSSTALPVLPASWFLFLTPVSNIFLNVMYHVLERALGSIGRHYRMRLTAFNTLEVDKNMATLDSCGIPKYSMPTEVGGSLALNAKRIAYERIIEDLFVAGVDCVEDDTW
eukprot:CAMPEP_0195285374 /NCGR_PEP_ID=MMETSP0707-20130614/3231_1 /TAXON_ID=33640 /ORGANISM="Asterionellopsis glacialis, Strain CCMP134" /LENGTH=347 /DNA_ID=CAMNT_0040344857 /DNA_START=267 /DNA_END=1307 /DNA_ORIENTATION=+